MIYQKCVTVTHARTHVHMHMVQIMISLRQAGREINISRVKTFFFKTSLNANNLWAISIGRSERDCFLIRQWLFWSYSDYIISCIYITIIWYSSRNNVYSYKMLVYKLWVWVVGHEIPTVVTGCICKSVLNVTAKNDCTLTRVDTKINGHEDKRSSEFGLS